MSKNTSYAEAVKGVKGQKIREVEQKEREIPQKLQTEENIELFISYSVFIAYVINCTDQAKLKAEKIKIIVRGAEKFLSFKERSLENINKRLETEERPGTSADNI
ncbi:hypothetical protein CHARACLAT_026272 [Characodon lateralis]|uniref:Uncharacterized protein n=1 Tax=Characodon lateralis TaxID=208331 RepID=A0ABU7CRY1_9TELE|nr:hypothetical protein [Characodon lateralis]